MWDVTVRSSKRLDAFDQWCLRHILRVSFTAHVTNQEVRLHSAHPPGTQTVMLRCLRLFGHIVRSDSDEDHSRALNAAIDDPPKEWRRPHGGPRQTWLRTVENDLKQQNLGCGWPGTELTTGTSGVKSWKQRQWLECRQRRTSGLWDLSGHGVWPCVLVPSYRWSREVNPMGVNQRPTRTLVWNAHGETKPQRNSDWLFIEAQHTWS